MRFSTVNSVSLQYRRTSHDSRNDNDGIPLMLTDPDLFHIFLPGGDRDDQRFWIILADGIGVHRECSASIPEENRRCAKPARGVFTEDGIGEIGVIGGGLRPIGTDPADRVAVDLVPGAQKSGASAIRIDAVIRIENLHGFAASVPLLAILADKGRPAHEVIGAPGRVFLIVFIHKPVDFPLLLLTERGDGFSLFEKAVD